MENIFIGYRTPNATPECPIPKHITSTSMETDPVLSLNKGMFREIGDRGFWSVSSQKAGFGRQNMRDNLPDTYWQSDGQLPHLISVLFTKKTTVSDICIFISYEKDESYTPSLLSLRCGTSFSDLRHVDTIELHEPNGWILIPLKNRDGTDLLRAFLFQVAILRNHQNGRDSHVRQIKIHSPLNRSSYGLLPHLNFPSNFTTPEFLQFASIR